jgi:histidinol dehydrogenase
VIRVSAEGARRLGPLAAELARGEGLTAHAKSAEYRLQESNRQDAKAAEKNKIRN